MCICVRLAPLQIPVPPKKPQKPKAQDDAPKPDVPKPDLQDVERWIEAEGATSAPARQTDDVFGAVPDAKKDKKEKKKRDRRKKVLDVEFGERRALPLGAAVLLLELQLISVQ